MNDKLRQIQNLTRDLRDDVHALEVDHWKKSSMLTMCESILDAVMILDMGLEKIKCVSYTPEISTTQAGLTKT